MGYKHRYDFPGQVGELFRDERTRLKLTRQAMGLRVGIYRENLGRIERDGPLTVAVVRRLAAGLGKELVWEMARDRKRGPWIEGDPAELVRHVRQEEKEGQIAFARRLGVAQPLVADIERASKNPSIAFLSSVMDICGWYLCVRLAD